MMVKTNIISNFSSGTLHSMSDEAIVMAISRFIRHNRLAQNKTQSQLAEESGINRSTLVEFEQGKRSNLITLIQLLRALDQLYVLQGFEVQQQISPIKLAEMEQAKRKRASKTRQQVNKPKSDW